ncbi:MAG: tyrosine-type recombinase/integrase [Anaerovoracaceae bacterium]
MKRISSKSRKVKSQSGKHPKISREHQQRILKFRQSSTPLRERFREDLTLHKFAPRTVERYMDAAITFVAYFNRPPQFITDDEIRAYLRYQSETRRLKSGSMWIIHGMLKYLYTKTLRNERPVLDIFRSPKDAPEKIILSQSQVAKALLCVRDIRFRTALELIYSCGLRETEALHLTVHDINRAQGLLSIHGKGGKIRMVPIADIMLEKLTILWKSHRHPELLFPAYHPWRRIGTPRTGTLDRPIIGQTLLLVWQKAVRESGFPKPINVHTLRHCYGTHLLEEGASERSVQDNLGHRSSRTTSTYVHQTAKRTRQSADAIERIAQNLPR